MGFCGNILEILNSITCRVYDIIRTVETPLNSHVFNSFRRNLQFVFNPSSVKVTLLLYIINFRRTPKNAARGEKRAEISLRKVWTFCLSGG